MKPNDTAADQVAPGSLEWHRLVEDDELRTFLTATRLQGIHQCDIAAALGWTLARAERVRRRLDRRLKQIRGANLPRPYPREFGFDGGSSMHPFYREHFQSGHWVWTLSRSNLSACPKLPKGVENFSREQLKAERLRMRIAERRLTMDELREAKATLDKVLVRAQEADRRVEVLELKAVELRQQATAEAEMAIIEGREPDTRFAAALAKAETELSKARQLAGQHAGAVARQCSIVEGIIAELQAKRHKTFLTAVSEPRATLNAALEAFLGASTAVHQVIAEYADVAGSFNPFPDPADSHGQERALARQLVALAARLDMVRRASYQPGFEWRPGAAA